MKLKLFSLCFVFFVKSLFGNEINLQKITITFAGDVMAHDTNYKMSDYNKIYADIGDILLFDDLSFCNMEMPICDELPMSSYPQFNVHSLYLKAAILGGFDVFSLANNHTNDKGVKGIDGTFKSFENMQKEFSDKKVFCSGIKQTVQEKMNATTINKNGFKILFLSVTEILNIHDTSKKRLYYSAPSIKAREKLLEDIRKMRDENPCDLFILSLHLSEKEYGTTVSVEKKRWFNKLANAGVDVIAGSHPHVMQSWEKVVNGKQLLNARMEDGNFSLHSSFFMYSLGNFISAQRIVPNYKNPKHYREYTGDAVLLQLTFTKLNDKVLDNFTVKPIPVTVYNSADGLVMKKFNEKFIENLPREQDKNYYKARLKIMKDYLPLQ